MRTGPRDHYRNNIAKARKAIELALTQAHKAGAPAAEYQELLQIELDLMRLIRSLQARHELPQG